MKRVMLAALLLGSPAAFAETGIASYYGKAFHGKTTANGEKYNMYGISAAHKTRKLGSYVTVTNLANGDSQRAKINDRGPFIEPRILDMSVGLKNAIGCTDLCKVRVS